MISIPWNTNTEEGDSLRSSSQLLCSRESHISISDPKENLLTKKVSLPGLLVLMCIGHTLEELEVHLF